MNSQQDMYEREVAALKAENAKILADKELFEKRWCDTVEERDAALLQFRGLQEENDQMRAVLNKPSDAERLVERMRNALMVISEAWPMDNSKAWEHCVNEIHDEARKALKETEPERPVCEHGNWGEFTDIADKCGKCHQWVPNPRLTEKRKCDCGATELPIPAHRAGCASNRVFTGEDQQKGMLCNRPIPLGQEYYAFCVLEEFHVGDCKRSVPVLNCGCPGPDQNCHLTTCCKRTAGLDV